MLSRRVKKLTPYVPGEQPQIANLIKLNTNENPYPPSPGVTELLRSFNSDRLKLYPDPLFAEPRKSISKVYGIPEECIFIGNGSDELLAFSFYAFFESERGPLLFPDITYSFYPVYCTLYDIEYREVPLTGDFSMDLEGFIEEKRSTGIIFPNPNAPTGKALTKAEIKNLLENTPADRAVIVDEAYVDFGAESCVPLIADYPNLLVIKTMSKSYSLAGMRLGYAFGQPPLIQAVTAVKDSFNSYPVSMLGQRIMSAAVEDTAYHKEVCSRVIGTRERMISEFRNMGWNCLDSKSNFIFVSKPGTSGDIIQKKLRDEHIIVRRFTSKRIENWLRITVGTDSEVESLLTVCRGIE